MVSVGLSLHEAEESIEQELTYGRYSGVIISTLPRPISHWLAIDLPGRVRRHHPEVQVIGVTAPADFCLDEEGLPLIESGLPRG